MAIRKDAATSVLRSSNVSSLTKEPRMAKD